MQRVAHDSGTLSHGLMFLQEQLNVDLKYPWDTLAHFNIIQVDILFLIIINNHVARDIFFDDGIDRRGNNDIYQQGHDACHRM